MSLKPQLYVTISEPVNVAFARLPPGFAPSGPLYHSVQAPEAGGISLDISGESLLVEIRERISLLESNLPRQVDALAVSQISKLPFKALAYREALIWRMTELSGVAFRSFESDKLVSAILLTRAAVETSAALWYLCDKVGDAVQSGAVADIDDYLMKLMMGSKTNPDTVPKAINVLTFVDRVDKEIEGLRHQYDMLSEFAHPNWAGTTLLYSKSDPSNFRTTFGANIRAADGTKNAGLLNLSVALMIFERSYTRVSDCLPDFITLCEDNLTSTTSAPSR